ncbi:hypothetical protein ACIRVN_33785 [Streptomyces albogriseolus]|uniref:hypothetical protein n=1 Tax=Streptomyces albogriseolus TaxID=1887 RepID=UPI00382EC279
MIDSDDTQPPDPRPNRVLDALKRAERKVFTRPAPKSAKAQIEFLYTRAKRSTKALAEQLSVSPRTVQRYRAGQQTKPLPWWRRPNLNGNRRSGRRRGSDRLPPAA